jgi:hypothetical protein
MNLFGIKLGGSRALPLGIDIGSAGVSAVALSFDDAGARVDAAAHVATETNEPDALVAALQSAVKELGSGEQRCIIGLAEPDAYAIPVAFAPGMRRSAIVRAAQIEARRFDEEFPPRDRALSLAAASQPNGRFVLGVAKRSAIGARTALVRRAGLRVHAVDNEHCAWRRAQPDADAVLDFGVDRARLIMFGDPIGENATFFYGDHQDEDEFIEAIRGKLNVARLEDIADVRSLAISGSTRGREDLIERLAVQCGVSTENARLGDLPADLPPPPWLLAYGLALWSFAVPLEDAS